MSPSPAAGSFLPPARAAGKIELRIEADRVSFASPTALPPMAMKYFGLMVYNLNEFMSLVDSACGFALVKES